MDAKLASYMAKQIAGFISRDKNVNPAIRAVVQDVMGAKMDTLKHNSIDNFEAADLLNSRPATECNFVTFTDGSGRERTVVFI